MRIHEELKTKSRKFLSLTNLRPDEFMGLPPAFERAYQRKYSGSKTIAGKVRKRQVGTGRKGSLQIIRRADKKITTEILHIHGSVRSILHRININQRTCVLCHLCQFADRIDCAQRVGCVSKCDDLWFSLHGFCKLTHL